jgi:RNA polymerase sigma factor (sigma-70 family)
MAMESGKAGEVGRQLEVLWTSGTLTGLSDSQLLSQYVNARGRDTVAETAFRELVHRHGPMVLGICRQILRRHHDADDAFQATFLILVRKARSIQVDDSLAPWLCSVAYRTAQRARIVAARYRPIDAVQIEEPSGSSPDGAYHFDLRPLLLEELDRLPGKFREAIVLCHLEGKSHEEAARLLRWPIGTLSSRLSRGRQLLRSRLERRGLEISSVVFSANWMAGTPTIVARPLLESTVTAAIGSAMAQAVPSLVLSLTHGVLRTMWLRKLATISLVIFLTGATSGSLAVWAHWPSTASKASVPGDASAPSLAPDVRGMPNRDAGSAPQPAQPPTPSQSGGDDVRLTDCPAGTPDFVPHYCPISIAANAVSRFINHLHQATSEPSP